MHDRRFAYAAVLVIVSAVAALLVKGGVTAAAADDRRSEPFQFYSEIEVIDYYTHQINMVVPRNRLAVIEWVSFRATSFQCKLTGLALLTSLKDKGALHTVAGAIDVGPTGVGRQYGLSQEIKAFAGPGTTVTISFLPDSTTGSCAGDGVALTVTGHYER